MNPISVALNFIVFWLLIGLGAFLFFNTLSAFLKNKNMRAVAVLGLLPPAQRPSGLAALLNLALLLVGMAMMLGGLYANYVVIYR